MRSTASATTKIEQSVAKVAQKVDELEQGKKDALVTKDNTKEKGLKWGDRIEKEVVNGVEALVELKKGRAHRRRGGHQLALESGVLTLPRGQNTIEQSVAKVAQKVDELEQGKKDALVTKDNTKEKGLKWGDRIEKEVVNGVEALVELKKASPFPLLGGRHQATAASAYEPPLVTGHPHSPKNTPQSPGEFEHEAISHPLRTIAATLDPDHAPGFKVVVNFNGDSFESPHLVPLSIRPSTPPSRWPSTRSRIRGPHPPSRPEY
ncbi:hypothetical protein Droror1_Dr00026931, partial [Drosera rotundifolia]